MNGQESEKGFFDIMIIYVQNNMFHLLFWAWIPPNILCPLRDILRISLGNSRFEDPSFDFFKLLKLRLPSFTRTKKNMDSKTFWLKVSNFMWKLLGFYITGHTMENYHDTIHQFFILNEIPSLLIIDTRSILHYIDHLLRIFIIKVQFDRNYEFLFR